MPAFKSIVILLAVLKLYPLVLYSQTLNSEQWTKVISILKTNDSVELSRNWDLFSANAKDVLLVATLTNKPDIFKWTMQKAGSGIKMSELSDWFNLSLRAGFLEIPKTAADMGWIISSEAWLGLIQCNYTMYLEMLRFINSNLIPLLPKSRPQKDYMEVAQWLINEKVPFNYAAVNGTLLQQSPHSLNIFKLLLKNQAPPESMGTKADWLLFIAVQKESADSVRKILSEGNANPNFVQGERSLLWYSVQRNDPAMARYLLQAGANSLWMDTDSSMSSLSEAVVQGNVAMVRELLPFIPSVNYRHKHGNTVLHYLADYSLHDIHDAFNRCSVTSDTNGIFRPEHVAIIRMLKDAGADFNIKNEYDKLAFERFYKTSDTNWISIVQVFAENLTNQSRLVNFAQSFNAIINKKEEKLFQTIISKLDDISFLLHAYLPEQGTSSAEKDNLMRQLIFYSRKLPPPREFASLLRRYVLNKSLDMVRYILYDVTKKYSTLQPGINTDSLKSIMVNQLEGRCATTIVQDIICAGPPDPVTVKIMHELMLCRPLLSIRNKCTYQTAFDELIGNSNMQKAFGSSLLISILQQQMTDVNKSNAVVVNPETGDRLRRNLFAFRQDRHWIKDHTFCFDAMLRGDGLIINGSNIQVNVADYGMQNTGDWPKTGCDSIKTALSLNNTSANSAYPYNFNAERRLQMNQVPSVDLTGQWLRRYDLSKLELSGDSGLEGLTLTGNTTITIPACVFEDSIHFALPAIIIKNESPSFLSVEQGMNQFLLVSYQDTLLDRSMGPITLRYSTKGKNIHFASVILGNLNYTSFENLLVGDGSNITDRVKVYLEIARLTSYLAERNLPNPEKKNMLVTIHLLSEYGMQCDYLSRIKEDYKRVNDQISTMEEALINLNNFYRNFATLSWENLPTLIRQLQLAVAATGTPPKERGRYQVYLDQLTTAQSLTELAKIYNELFNNKFNQTIDQAVNEYQRVALELMQYPMQTVVKTVALRKLLMRSPTEFHKAVNQQVKKKTSISN